MPRQRVFGLRVARLGLAAALILSAGCSHRRRAVSMPPASAPPQTIPSAPAAQQVPGQAPIRIPARIPSRPTIQAPVSGAVVQGEEGIASWYGVPFHGRSTSSGEIYNMYDVTAAHKTLPFGTLVRVHNLANGETVDVRVNDRGPFVEGRIIDLSYTAAQAIHLVGPGTSLVRLEILNPEVVSGPAAQPGVFAVQIGAFRDPTNAQRLKQRVESQFGPVIIQSFDRGDGLFNRVRVGRASTEDAAQALAIRLQQAGLATQTFVVRLN